MTSNTPQVESTRASRHADPVRALRVPRPRHTFGPVSVGLLVGLQLLALTVALVRMATTPGQIALLGLLGTTGLLLAIPLPTGSLGRMLARRLSFATRPRVVDRLDPKLTHGSAGPTAGAALYPGLVVRTVRDHRGRSLGVAEWSQVFTAVVAIGDLSSAPVRPDLRHRVPLTAIHDRLRAGDIPVDALGVHVVLPASGLTTVASGPWWRGRRDVYVSVRLRPLSARDAVARRGGGRQGVEACIAALTAAVEAEVRAAGLAAETLDAEALSRAVDLVAAPIGAPRGSVAEVGDAKPWTESWDQVAGGGAVHRTFVGQSWRPDPSGLAGVDLFQGVTGDGLAGVSASVELRPGCRGVGGGGGTIDDVGATTSVRVSVRVSASGAQQAAQAANRVIGAAASAGLALSPAVGDQLVALRAGSLLGDGAPAWAPDATAVHPVAAAWLGVPQASLEGLAPVLGGGVFLGHAGDGDVVVADLVRARPQRIVTVGEGWLAGVLVGRAVRSGIRVVVCTDRPAPWQALTRQLGVEDGVFVVPPDARTIPGDGDPAARLIVAAGAGIGAPGARQAWQTLLTVLPSADGEGSVITAADVVLVTRAAITDEFVRLVGLGPTVATRLSGLAEFDVAAITSGRVEIVRVDPDA